MAWCHTLVTLDNDNVSVDVSVCGSNLNRIFESEGSRRKKFDCLRLDRELGARARSGVPLPEIDSTAGYGRL